MMYHGLCRPTVLSVQLGSHWSMKPIKSSNGNDTRETRRLATLLDVSQALSGTLNLKSALHRVLEILGKHHGAVRSVVTFLSEEGELFVEAADGLDEPPQSVRYRVADGITGRGGGGH